jgi:hypothetical protein
MAAQTDLLVKQRSQTVCFGPVRNKEGKRMLKYVALLGIQTGVGQSGHRVSRSKRSPNNPRRRRKLGWGGRTRNTGKVSSIHSIDPFGQVPIGTAPNEG